MGVKQEELNMGNDENAATTAATQDNVQTGTVTSQAGATAQGSEQHLFTQEQLNSIISGRINALNQRVGELSTALEKSNKLTEQYHDELEGYKRKEIALKEGISAELVDYAIFGANKLVSKDKPFEAALKEFKEANKALFGVTQQAGSSGNGSTQANNNGQQAQQGTQQPSQTTQTVNMNGGTNPQQGGLSEEEQIKQYLEKKRQSLIIKR
jgi:hypothetical protein